MLRSVPVHDCSCLAAVLSAAGTMSSGLRPIPVREQFTAFGRVVAISGEYAFVGEPSAGGRGGGAAAAGVVHVYRRGPTGVEGSRQAAPRPASAAGDAFGIALAVDGATLLVGQDSAGRRAAGALGANGAVHARSDHSRHVARRRASRTSAAPTGSGLLAGPVGEATVGSQFGAALASPVTRR